MHDHLPKPLQDAMERLLAADADSERAPEPRSNVERIEALRAARAILAMWRKGEIEEAEAVRRIDALVGTGRAG